MKKYILNLLNERISAIELTIQSLTHESVPGYKQKNNELIQQYKNELNLATQSKYAFINKFKE